MICLAGCYPLWLGLTGRRHISVLNRVFTAGNRRVVSNSFENSSIAVNAFGAHSGSLTDEGGSVVVALDAVFPGACGKAVK